ncbi:MAG: hypothetical protein WAV41_02730 [Microgenomates group bacterium]
MAKKISKLDASRKMRQVERMDGTIRELNRRWENDGLDAQEFLKYNAGAFEILGRKVQIDITKNPPFRRVDLPEE